MMLSRWIASFFLALSLSTSARAQGEQRIPPDVTALYEQIVDIDKLRVLNPLKLSPDQIDRLVAAIKEWEAKYVKEVSEVAVSPVRAIADEVKATRKRMLAGGSVPKTFDDKVKSMQDKFVERSNKAEYDTVKGLAASVKQILKPDQISTAENLAKKALTPEGKEPPKLIFLNYYVLTIFIQYPRIVPLLEEMKKAQTASL